MLADEARLGSKRSGELVALRLGADHRLELFSRGAVQLPIDDEDGLRVLQRSFRLFERLGARRLAHFKRAAVLAQPQIVLGAEEVLLVGETGDEARRAAIC